MPTYVLYEPTEGSHADATTLIADAAIIYEGDFDGDGNLGDDPLAGETALYLGLGKAALGSGANTKIYHTLFRITLPEGPKTSPTGDLIGDKNTAIKKIVLKFRCNAIFSGSANPDLAAFSPMIRPISAIDYDTMTYKTYDGTNAWAADGGFGTGDRDDSTDFGSGVDGVIAKVMLPAAGWVDVVLQNNEITGPSQARQLGLDWGQTVDILMFAHGAVSFATANNYSQVFNLAASASNRPYLEVHYEDDKPTKPEISVKALDDFRHAEISFTKRPEDEDLTQYVMSWRQGGVPTYQTGASAPSYGKANTDTGKETYHGFNDLYNDGVGNTTFFPGGSIDAGQTNQLTIWAEDNNNSGSSGATKGNTVSLTRYQPYTIETFTDGAFAKSCSVSWILVGQHTGSDGASVLTDGTSGTTTPWLRGNFVKNGVEIGDKVYNISDRDGSTPGVATISGVTDSTITGSLGSGTQNDWDQNEIYAVVRKVDVGEKVSLTIRSTRIDGLLFDKIGVNWTNTSAGHISDDAVSTMDDFDIIELDTTTSEHTISYRYTTAGTYYPNFFFVDAATGFRTILRQVGAHNSSTETGYALTTTNSALVVEQPKPIPRLTSSKSIGESANVALDRSSAVIYSGANSTATGSDAYVKSYKWLGENVVSQTLTQGCLDIDNTPLINESKKLYMRCNTAGYNASVFTIYGLVSFQADNSTSVKDTDTTFSHYRYVKATVSPSTAKYLTYNTADTFGTAAVQSGTAEQMFFKQVDFIYCTTKSGTSGTEECYQLLAADSDNNGAIDAVGTLDTSTVCKRLVIDSNNGSPGYKWGGFCTVTGSSNITFTKESGADEIESTAIDFITAGFGPGDTITVESSLNEGVYTIQKIEKIGSKYSMYLNEELAVTEASTSATIYTTQPTISVASNLAGTAKISLNVTDNSAASGDAAVNIYTIFRDQTSLDLNASADSGYIAIQNASFSRSGGISAAMPLGERRYPPGAVHTKHGLPKMSMTVRIIDITGFNRMYRLLNNSYNYAIYQHHDTAFATWVKYRLKLESFTVNRDPQNLEHQVVSMSFFIVGEEV
jgi:hypothetical protein